MSDILAFIFVILFILGIFLGLPYGLIKRSEYSCHKTAEIYQVESVYNWSTGCFLKHKGGYLPQEDYERLLYLDKRFKTLKD